MARRHPPLRWIAALGAAGAILAIVFIAAAYPYLSTRGSMESVFGLFPAVNDIPLATAVVETGETQNTGALQMPDWSALGRMNPDVVAWIRVPDSGIDYPIVAARPSDPFRYLSHDINDAESPYGCPFIDADISDAGIDAPCVTVYGHHLIDGSIFSDFARYSDETYASAHRRMELYTPDGVRRLETVGVCVVNADEEYIRTRFADVSDAALHLADLLNGADVVLERPREFERVWQFVTCSYGRPNERTVVLAVERSLS